MVQNVSWEWLLEGFKYELEVVVKPETVDYYYSHVGVFIRWAQHRGQLANPYLTTKRHIQDFFHYLLHDWHIITVGNGANRQIHHTDRTRWHYYRGLRRFFSWVVKEGHLEHNPLDGITLTAPKPLQIEPYRPEHVEKMLAVLNHEWNVANTARQSMLAARDHAVLVLFLESGLRLGEMIGLRISDIDLTRQRVLVSSGKMGKGRIAGFGPQAKKSLWRYLGLRGDDLPHDSLWVTEEERPLTKHGVQQIIRRLKRSAGFQLPTPSASSGR
jgi:site-specific recombinase XerD